MRKSFILPLFLAMASPAAAETLTNDMVVSLLEAGLGWAGLGDEVVIAKIKASPSSFDTSTDQISPGVYKIVPTTALIPGEYGFISGAVGAGANATFRVFDFTVN